MATDPGPDRYEPVSGEAPPAVIETEAAETAAGVAVVVAERPPLDRRPGADPRARVASAREAPLDAAVEGVAVRPAPALERVTGGSPIPWSSLIHARSVPNGRS